MKKIVFYITVILIPIIYYYGSNFYTSYTDTAKTEEQLKHVLQALERYKIDKDNYPSDKLGLSALLKNGSPIHYLTNELDLIDPWQNPIQYQIYEDKINRVVVVYSFGPNGKDDQWHGDDLMLKYSKKRLSKQASRKR